MGLAAAILVLTVAVARPPLLQAQTALPVASPESLVKQSGTRSDIERCILAGNPESLLKAKEGLKQSKSITEAERKALQEIVRGIELIVYPSTAKNPPEAFSLPANLGSLPLVYSIALSQLVEASQGRIFPAPKGTEASILHELMPALAVFRSADKETAVLAQGYAERFAKTSQQGSALAALTLARATRVSGSLSDAHALYRRALETYPDLWPARLALGSLSLQLSMPVNALNYLEPLAATMAEDARFIEPYAIALYKNARLQDAAAQAAKAKAAGSATVDLSLISAHVYIDAGKYFEAQPLLEAYGRAHPDSREYLVLKILYARGMDRTDEAAKWARKALETHPEDPEFEVYLASALLATPGADFEEARKLCAASADSFAERARSLYRYPSPLEQAMAEEAEREGVRVSLADAYNRQDWYAAAELLGRNSTVGLDKSMVATILRKSGNTADALAFSSDWYKTAPTSDAAAEAYLRSLAAAATGTGLAAAGQVGTSDSGAGLLGLISASGLGSQAGASQSPLVGLMLQLLSASNSPRMRSYLYYLRGSLQTDETAAVESYKLALLERADNVEALLALARIYIARNDPSKASFYLRQAKAVGIKDLQLATELATLEASLADSLAAKTAPSL